MHILLRPKMCEMALRGCDPVSQSCMYIHSGGWSASSYTGGGVAGSPSASSSSPSNGDGRLASLVELGGVGSGTGPMEFDGTRFARRKIGAEIFRLWACLCNTGYIAPPSLWCAGALSW